MGPGTAALSDSAAAKAAIWAHTIGSPWIETDVMAISSAQ
jgi:hypothetical protein